jgi:predicted aspartyl protease
MWRWLRFILLVFPFFAPEIASAQVDTMAAVHGSCEIFIVAGIQTPCPPKGVMYSHLTNGRVLLSVALPTEEILSFVGEKDSQPRLEEYWLYLSRVRIGSRATEIVAQVAGQCVVHMTRDGTAWFRLDCDATDEQNRAYRLHFEADGRQIGVVHPSDTADAQAVPPTPPVATPTPASSSTRVGPSFDCSAVRTPGAQLICSSPDMSRLDLMFVQAYYAMRQQVGEAGWQTLKVEAVNFEDQTLQRCGIPLTGALPPDPRPWIACLAAAYERQRAAWLSRLSGPGEEEARRLIEEHVALQQDLQVIGLLPASETIDGVYGSATRTAILAWQQSKGSEPTGFIGNADAARLERQVAPEQPSPRALVGPSSSGMSGALAGRPETLDLPASAPNPPASQSSSLEIALERDGGTLVAPVSINNAITLKFVIDSGASDVNITADVVLTLMRAGTIDESDFLGSRAYQLADGSTVPSQTFRIRVLKVGDLEIDNVTASIGDVKGTLLLGQSFLSRFRSWSIDNQRRVLVLNQ